MKVGRAPTNAALAAAAECIERVTALGEAATKKDLAEV